jgi:hypothetical protein
MDEGTLALDRIENHERICAERYEGLQYSVRKLERILWAVAGTTILQLLAACSYLVVHAGLK